MQDVRETRYTMEVMEVAAATLDATKERVIAMLDGDDADVIGTGILTELGWAPFAIEEFADSMTATLCRLFNLDPGARTVEALKLALLEGYMMGALVEQAAYEKGFGL